MKDAAILKPYWCKFVETIPIWYMYGIFAYI